MEKQFREAVDRGLVGETEEILRNNPKLDVNLREGNHGDTALHRACSRNDDSMGRFLFAHPDIDVNRENNFGFTPFMRACFNGSTSCVRLLLKDCRVEVNQPDTDGYTPLWQVSFWEHIVVAKWWIASGREMDLGSAADYKTDAIGRAAQDEKELGILLERFKENPDEIRHAKRLEIGWYNEAAAEMFALVVFVSDGLLRVTQSDQSMTTHAVRFFNIASHLPLELQMVLCHRVVGSSKEIIHGEDSEVAFKSLAESLLWSSFFTN